MLDETNRNQRIAKNTILLYFRMLLLMIVSLYTSRVVLEMLGIEDYGIYNVVGGFVSMFAFLNGAMGASTMRYITYALGTGNSEELSKVFSSSLMTHIIISIIVIVFAETLGLWFIINKLIIPSDHLIAAIVVFETSILSTVLIIMSYPFYADIIAHEKMSAFAYISIFEVFAKLGVVFILLVSHTNRLILYALLLLVVQFIVTTLYSLYCRRHFVEAKFKFDLDCRLLKEMFSFTGWNLWGGLASTLFSQGLNILLNLFFGPAVNAARGIAVQVQSTVNQFSSNFQTAINPQITKTYACGKFKDMFYLIFRSSKFTFLLLLVLTLPLSFDINWILKIWLPQVPEFTNIFIIIMFGTTIIDGISNPLMTAVSATGKVKIYQSIVGGILLLIVPVSYIVLKMGGEPYSVFIVHFSIAIIAFVARLIILKNLISLPLGGFIKNAILPALKVLIIAILFAVPLKVFENRHNTSPIITMLIIFTITCIISYMLGLSKSEKRFLIDRTGIFINRLTHRT